MAIFELAIPVVLEHEGGFIDSRFDPGGATNWGVSLRFALDQLRQDLDGDGWMDGDIDHDGDIDRDDIRKMSRDDAIEIYRIHFWKPEYAEIVDQNVATKLFDMAVNMGGGQAAKIVQRAINECFGHDVLVVDGGFGAKSVAQCNAALQKYGARYVLTNIRQEAWAFYEDLMARKPSLQVFAKGWRNRAFA